jgi:uncharacterized protein (UPF0264 family)
MIHECENRSPHMGLLVSVRSVAEAEAALAGRASLIDVKEPARGALGRADEGTIAAVIQFVGGRRPVSAALGELAATPLPFPGTGLSYAKWGLAGWAQRPNWRQALTHAGDTLRRTHPDCRLVVTAYADWHRADAPPPGEICTFVCSKNWQAFLLDTWGKDGTSLLDWIPRIEVERICRRCRDCGVEVALAGSLEMTHIQTLGAVRPDWFGVRGAVCYGGRRSEGIDPVAVRRLADILEGN